MLTELMPYKQWVVRRADKVPLNPRTGLAADPTNPDDWGTFEEAQSCCTPENGIGLGFVLTENDPFAVIDLDDPTDPKFQLTPEEIAKAHLLHEHIFKAFDTYSERSPSGRGLHIWCKGSVPSGKNNRKSCVEVYSTGRYMTVTGWAHHPVGIQNRNELLNQLWQDMGGKAPVPTVQAIDGPQTIDDWTLCNKAAQGANGNGQLFVDLYQGNWQQHYPSESEADIALCNIIAFYTDNKEQTCRIYYASKLFQNSPKKKRKSRPDYLLHESWGIVTKAFDRKGPMIEDIEKCVVASIEQENEDKEIEEQLSQDEINDKPAEIDWLAPEGLMGQIANFIYENAVNPMPEVAVAASLAYVAAFAGRSWNYSRTGLNQYIVLLAETGQGKESAAQGMDRLNHSVFETMPALVQFIGASDIKSPEGLMKQLADTPCFLTHKGEFGMWLQKLTGKYARQNEVSLRGMLLDLYSKSGYTQTLRGALYSDKQKNIPTIQSPAFSLFGDSTQQEFYKALDEENISEGLISRFTIIQANADKRPQFNPNHGKAAINPEMVKAIQRLGENALQIINNKLAPITVQETMDAKAFQEQYREWAIEKMWSDRETPIGKIWNRAHLRLLRTAALVAVGRNPDMPVVTLGDMQWAAPIINHSVEQLAYKFKMGEVGAHMNPYLEQRMLIGRQIRRYVNDGWKESYQRSYNVSPEMYKARVITERYLRLVCGRHAAFRNDRNPLQAIKNVLQSYCDDGNLTKIEMHKIRDAGRQGVGYYITDMKSLPK
jgi:hypothetical protein